MKTVEQRAWLWDQLQKAIEEGSLNVSHVIGGWPVTTFSTKKDVVKHLGRRYTAGKALGIK